MDSMGFVFIILAFIGVLVSLLEQKGKIINVNFEKAAYKRLAWQGYFLIANGVFLTALNIFIFKLNALYVTSTLSVFLGIFLAGDANGYFHDPKVITIEAGWFKTTTGFKIASGGIVLILFLLYFFLY